MSRDCPAPGPHSGAVVVVAVPPDLPFALSSDGPELQAVRTTACEGHVAVVRMMMERQYAPRRSAYRDGRPAEEVR